MPIEFRPATIEGVGCWVSIAGGSSSGKTRSALRLARGMVGEKGKIAAIDTEGRRMSHHSKVEKFDVFDMKPPYAPLRFAEIAEDAQAAGYGALIVDSFSLEWTGTGGVTDTYDTLFTAKGKNQKLSDVCWSEAKKPHKAMRDRLMQLSMPVIFALRCNEVAKHLGGGWKVEHDKRWMYEWTVGLSLHPDAPGMPCYDMRTAAPESRLLAKVPEELLHLFPTGQLIGEAAGEGLAAWRHGELAKLRAQAAGPDKQRDGKDKMLERIALADTKTALDLIVNDQSVMQWRFRLGSQRPELEAEIKAAVAAAYAQHLPPPEDASEADDFPGVVTPREAA